MSADSLDASHSKANPLSREGPLGVDSDIERPDSAISAGCPLCGVVGRYERRPAFFRSSLVVRNTTHLAGGAGTLVRRALRRGASALTNGSGCAILIGGKCLIRERLPLSVVRFFFVN